MILKRKVLILTGILKKYKLASYQVKLQLLLIKQARIKLLMRA